VLAAAPQPSDDGLDTIDLADTTSTSAQTRAETTALFVQLTGTGTLQLSLWARVATQDDGDLGWSLLYDTGNPGLLGGGPLAAPGSYTFLVNHAMIFEEIVLVKSAVSADGDAAAAVLINYDEFLNKR
jgi:hypothetical protein